MITEQTLQNCINWNITHRDHARTVAERRHYQRNIDQLNAQLRNAPSVSDVHVVG